MMLSVSNASLNKPVERGRPAEKGPPPARYSTFDVKKNAWQYDSLTKNYYLHYFVPLGPAGPEYILRRQPR